MHRRNEAMAGAHPGHRQVRHRARAARPATARRPADARPSCAPTAGATITPGGIGGLEALRVFGDVLAPACISVDHPRFLSFVPAAPTEASILFDLVVGASSIYGGSWLEGGGAVFAENEALRWIADLAGLPAGGRRRVRQRRHGGQPQRADRRPLAVAASAPAGRHDRTRGLLLASSGAHSSVVQAARAMDADVATVPADGRGRLGRTGAAGHPRRRSTTPIASGCSPSSPRAARPTPGSSTTSPAVAELCRRRWAPGCTSTAPTAGPHSPRRACADASTASRRRTASSSIRTSGCSPRSTRAPCCTAIPEIGRLAHTQHAEYLDVLHGPRRRVRVEPVRLRPPPDATCPRAAVVVQPGDPRHRRPTPTPSRPRCASPARAPSWSGPRRTSS